MGGDGSVENGHNYVFGFNKNGGRLSPVNLCGDSSKHNVPGGLYVFQIRTDIVSGGNFDLIKVGRYNRATKESFEKWYQNQNRYRLVAEDGEERR